MEPLRFDREVLTGRVRGRPRLFGLKGLIMQVEVRIETAGGFEILRAPPPPDCADIAHWNEKELSRVESNWKYKLVRWRDATWEDNYRLAIDSEKPWSKVKVS